MDNSKIYDVEIGSSRYTSATDRVGSFVVNSGSPTTLDAALNPPQTVIFSGVSPVSNKIIIEVDPAASSTFGYFNFLILTEND